ncbi:MAG: protein translocase subunit SecF [Spirochaetes bacterium]|nr:protein translocase subunit SecF [Spirochaetota bacterium]
MEERVIPFIKYRFIGYGLSISLAVIFLIMTVARGGIRMGVDFVGGQKIIAKFEPGVNEEKIRKALSAYDPLVQQIGEADQNEFIISTKIVAEPLSVLQEKIIGLMKKTFPDAELEKDRAVLMTAQGALNEAAVNMKLTELDAVFRRVGDPGKNIFLVYPKESADPKKSKYNPDTAVNLLRSAFPNIDSIKGVAVIVLSGRPVDQKKLADSMKESKFSFIRTEYAAKQGYIVYRVSVDESDRVQADLDRNFKNARVLSVESVGPAVGDYMRRSAIKLVLVAILLMTVYLAYRFEFRYSVGAMGAVLHDVFLSVIFCGAMGVEITIPVIAALLTIFGYSVNDTIVIFDRIRESTQIESKTSFVEIVNKSITWTMSRTILTSYLTLMTVFALFFLGGEGISDFAMVLLFGLIVGVYSTVYIASPIVISWERLMARIRS